MSRSAPSYQRYRGIDVIKQAVRRSTPITDDDARQCQRWLSSGGADATPEEEPGGAAATCCPA